MQAYYTDDTGNIYFTKFNHPFDINSYRNKNYNKILRNLILYSDNASGASFVFKRDFLEKYLLELKNTVVYEEDIIQVSMALNNEPMELFDEYFVYYEVNVGVSTKADSPFEQLLAKDVENFYEMMFKKYPDNKLLKKRNRLRRLYKINNLYLRTFLRIFVNPSLIFYLLDHLLQSISKAYAPKNKSSELTFLDSK